MYLVYNNVCIYYRLHKQQRYIGEYYSFSAPVVDCSNDFSFHNRQYSNVERGFLHHDGFVDCEEASGDYYVEDHNSAGLGGLISCHPSTGLCFTLTSGDNDGSTGAAVQIVNGNHRSYVIVLLSSKFEIINIINIFGRKLTLPCACMVLYN